MDEDLALSFESLGENACDAGCDTIFGSRVKNGQKSPHHHVIYFLLLFTELLFGSQLSWNNSEMVGNLGVVENTFVGSHPALCLNFSRSRVVA